MGTMSGIKATLGLSGSGVPSGVNVDGNSRIGESYADVPHTEADIIYSVTITGNDSGDDATLNLATGAITVNGTPDVTRRGTETDNLAAVDFEGADLPAMVTLYSVRIGMVTSVDTSNVVLKFSTTDTNVFGKQSTSTANAQCLWDYGDGCPTTSRTLVISPAEDGGIITITVAGKSS